MARPVTEPSLRFWQKVVRDPDSGCWIWTGERHRRDHHGRFYDGTRRVMAYRWSYEDANGVVPIGLTLDHICREPQCVNPAHLEPVTAQENQRRGNGFSGVNARKRACPFGHPYDERNTGTSGPGRRRCLTCLRERARQKRAASRYVAVVSAA